MKKKNPPCHDYLYDWKDSSFYNFNQKENDYFMSKFSEMEKIIEDFCQNREEIQDKILTLQRQEDELFEDMLDDLEQIKNRRWYLPNPDYFNED